MSPKRGRPKGTLSQACKGCAEKQQVIDVLHDTCASYEARIKRFQTLARRRRVLVNGHGRGRPDMTPKGDGHGYRQALLTVSSRGDQLNGGVAELKLDESLRQAWFHGELPYAGLLYKFKVRVPDRRPRWWTVHVTIYFETRGKDLSRLITRGWPAQCGQPKQGYPVQAWIRRVGSVYEERSSL